MGFLSPIEQVPMDDKFARCLEVDPDCVEGQNYADKLPSSARVASLVDEASDTRSCSYTRQSPNGSGHHMAARFGISSAVIIRAEPPGGTP